MGQRYTETGKIMPAGVVAGIRYIIWKISHVLDDVKLKKNTHI